MDVPSSLGTTTRDDIDLASSPSSQRTSSASYLVNSSSPPRSSPSSINSSGTQRTRKPPSITPRKFRRFFNPNEGRKGGETTERRPLSDLTASLNALSQPELGALPARDLTTPPKKRARTDGYTFTPAYSRHSEQPLKRISRHALNIRVQRREIDACQPIIYSTQYAADDLHRHPADRYSDHAQLSTPETHAPWSVACCKSNPIAALGLGDGTIAVIDTYRDCLTDDTKPADRLPLLTTLNLGADYPITDLDFSPNDHLIAACSTNNTTLFDLSHEKALYTLVDAHEFVTRVRWASETSQQVIATTGRSGNINLWDTRASQQKPSTRINVQSDTDEQREDSVTSLHHTLRIDGAHRTIPSVIFDGKDHHQQWYKDARQKCHTTDQAIRVSDLCFLPQSGANRYLLSSSSQGGFLRLWDLRSASSNAAGLGTPVSTSSAASQQGERRLRTGGLNSICVDETGSRVFGVGRDSIVHIWSVQHLAYGRRAASTLQTNEGLWSSQDLVSPRGYEQLGADPIYRIQLPHRPIRSGQIRCAYRAPSNGKPAMLAVGSSDGSPSVIPTAEAALVDARRAASALGNAERSDVAQSGASPTIVLGRQLEGLGVENPGVAWTSQSHLLGIYDHGHTVLWRDHAGVPGPGCRDKLEASMDEME